MGFCGGDNDENDYEIGYREGGAAAAGLLLMALAIQKNAPRVVERRYWTSEINGAKYYDCDCRGCGVCLKARDAGIDEGTDYEWCGACW
jgi:hypothetical protein